MQPKFVPCLIISVPALDEDRALVTLIPHKTQPRGSRFEVVAEARYLKQGAFDTQNLVTVPHAKLVRRLGAITDVQISNVEQSLRMWLGLQA